MGRSDPLFTIYGTSGGTKVPVPGPAGPKTVISPDGVGSAARKVLPVFLVFMLAVSFPLVPASDRSDADPSEDIPASYDMRDHYVMPAVRDQTPWGTCYAFSTLGMVESALCRDGQYRDMSELYLAATTYFDDGTGAFGILGETETYFDGGLDECCLQRLSSGYGSALEEAVPYSECSPEYRPPVLEPMLYVTGYSRYDMEKDVDEIKRSIMSGRQVGFGFAAEKVSYGYVGPDGMRYLIFALSRNTVNHGVTLAGWDDDFDRSYFGKNTPADGAWLIKNSWGESDAVSGYCWVSYWTTVKKEAYAVDSYFLADGGTHLYSYDPVPGNLTVEADTAANMFRAEGDEKLTEISFESYMRDFDYTVKIYTGCSPGDPVSGVLRSETSGHSDRGGLIKVGLDRPVNLYRGMLFSAVIAFEGEDASVCVEDSGDLVYDEAIGAVLRARSVSERGQSFILTDGVWEDVSASGHTNVRFKAYTADRDTSIPDGIKISAFAVAIAVIAAVCIPVCISLGRREA